MSTRKIVVLMQDPLAIKIILFDHPPRKLESLRAVSISYPYFLPATGEAGHLSVSVEVPGCDRTRTNPHCLVRNDNSVHTYTAGTNFTNAFLFGNFPEKWDESETVRLIPPIEIAPQLNVSLGYTAIDGGGRVFLPVIPVSDVCIELEIVGQW